MSATRLEVFDQTLHKTNIWLNDVMATLGSQDRHEAYIALRATLHTLRDRLTIEEATQLAAQLPMLVRGFYYEGWNPNGKPDKVRHRDEFLARIEQELPINGQADPECIARAVFAVLAKRVTEGEMADVEHVLPRDIRVLWP
jgi:uncharacterized protein (DUF2267 family)